MTRKELGSLLGVAGQMIGILTEQNVRVSLASLKPTDVLISPELGDFSTSDFDDMARIVPTGELAARKVASQLSKLSLVPDQYAVYRKALPTLVEQDLRPVDKIRFDNLKRVNPEYLRGLMDTQPGKPIEQNVLNRDLRRIFGTRDFEHVGYRITQDQGERTLVIDAVEKSWGPTYFRFGMGLEDDFQGDADFTAQGRIRKTWINSLGGEWLTDVQIGHTNRLASQFFQPIDSAHHYFVAPSIELRQNTNDLFSNDNLIARYEVKRYRVGIDFGREIGQYGQVRLGIRKGVIRPSLAIGDPNLSPSAGSIAEGAFQAGILLDKLNSVTFPTAGWLAGASIYNSNSSLGADSTYSKWDIRGTYVRSFGRNTFSLSGLANGKLNGTLPVYDQNQWGGFLRQSGYRSGQLVGESMTFGRLMYYKKLSDYKVFEGLYAGLSLELGRMRHPFVPGNSNKLLKSAAAFIATDSPIGPLYFGYGRAAGGTSSFYLYLGLPY